MKRNYFEVQLCNDDIKKYRVICTYTPVLGIREKVTNKLISIRCSHELCNINYGLTCEEDCYWVKEEEAKEYLSIFNDPKQKEAYKNYLDEVEKKSMEKYDSAYNLYKSAKKRKTRKKTK